MLDDTDRAIIAQLIEDGTRSNRTVAEAIGVSQGTVSNRVKRLEDLGVILGYTARINPEKIGWRMTVVVGIRIEKGRLLEIQGRIAEDPRVISVYDVTGDYDSMVIALAQEVPFAVDLNEGGGRNLFEEHTEGVQQEMILRPWHTQREMRVVEIGPAVEVTQPIGRRQLAARLPFLRTDIGRTTVLRKLDNRSFGHFSTPFQTRLREKLDRIGES